MNTGTAYVDASGSVQGAKANSRQRHLDTSLPRHTADLYNYRPWRNVPGALQTDTAEALNEAEANGQWVPALLRKSRKRQRDPYRYVLLLRFTLLNLVAFALLGAAYAQGLIDTVISADRTYLSVVIFLAFMGGLGLCVSKVWQTSRELNSVREADPVAQSNAMGHLAPLLGADAESRSNLAGALRLRLSHRIGIVRHIANSLVLLGLIGTVLGFIIALSGVDAEQVSDVSAITPMVSTLISGMSTALYTTLVGAVLNLWLMANYQLLVGGTVKLIAALMELGEGHGRDRIT